MPVGGERKIAGGHEPSAGGKSGLRGAGKSVTPTRGDPRESATEITPPKSAAATRKGRGDVAGAWRPPGKVEIVG